MLQHRPAAGRMHIHMPRSFDRRAPSRIVPFGDADVPVVELDDGKLGRQYASVGVPAAPSPVVWVVARATDGQAVPYRGGDVAGEVGCVEVRASQYQFVQRCRGIECRCDELTEALTYNYLAAGTITAYLQQRGVDKDLLRRHLQSPCPDRYVTQEALISRVWSDRYRPPVPSPIP